MENSKLRLVRPLSDIEKTYVVSHNLSYFTNICTTVRYECKNLFPSTSMQTLPELKTNIKKMLLPVLYRVLAQVILKEPVLSIGMSNPKAAQPYFVHIPTINLSQQIRFVIILSDEELGRILEIEHEKPFDLSTETALLWRITVTVHARRNDEICILFCCHHSMMDTVSLLTINTLFYNELKNVMHSLDIDNVDASDRLITDNDLLGDTTSTVNVPYDRMFEPWDKVVDVTPSMKLMIAGVWKKLLPPSILKSRSSYYAGDIHAMHIKDFHIKLRIMSLDPDELKSLLLISQQQNATLHAIIHTALLFSARQYLVDSGRDRKLSTLTPISFRPYANPTIENLAIGLYITTYNFTISLDRLVSGFWDVTKMYESELAKNTEKSIHQYTGLLKFCGKTWEKLCRNQEKLFPMGRQASLTVSNVDVWRPLGDGPEDEKVKILEMLTSQSPGVIDSAVTVNVATFGDRLGCTFVHQEGAIRPKRKLNQFINGFKRILMTVAKKGDWNGEWN